MNSLATDTRGGSLNRIISEIGLSKGSFYYYFDDKADLFRSVLDYVFMAALPKDPALMDFKRWDVDNFWSNIEGLHVASIHQTVDLPWLSALGKMLLHPPSELEEVINAEREKIRTLSTEVLDHGIAIGAIHDEQPREMFVSILWGAIEGSDRWFLDNWDELSRDERTRYAKQAFEVVRRLFPPPPTDDFLT